MTTTHRFPDVADAVSRLPRVVDLLAARAEEHDRDAGFPYQGLEAVHEAGLLTLTVGRRHGGAGGGLADTVRVLVELGRGDPSVALLSAFTLLTHARQTWPDPAAHWPESVYAELLADSVRGPALVGSVGALDASDSADLFGARPASAAAVTARLEHGQWRLTGREPQVAGAEALAWMAVTARTDEEVPREGVFLVPGDTPGIQTEPTDDQLGLRATASHDLVLRDVAVEPDAVLGLRPLGSSPRPGAAGIAEAWTNLALPAVYLGVARAARDWWVGSLRGGEPDAGTTTAVGLVEVELLGAEELLLSTARRVDAGDEEAVRRSGPVKLLATRASVGAVQRAVTLSGSAGLSRAHPLERHLRDVLHAHTLEPFDADILSATGRAALRRTQR